MENNDNVVMPGLGSDTETKAEQHTQKVRELNDQFRRSMEGGIVRPSMGLIALGGMPLMDIITCVRIFDDFSSGNDPYGEHDFGAFDFSIDDSNGRVETIFFKIDYYDNACEYGSKDPSDPDKTTRVLTIYLASEH